jgi:lysophospholipase L1-like esterase
MQDSKNLKNYKLISVTIVLGVVGAYLGILYFINTFVGSSGLAHFLNSENAMKNHRKELMKKVQRDPHFREINAEEYIKEIEKIITMEKKRSLGEWVSFKSFTPNILGKHITTNDYGMRSEWNLNEMIQRAKNNHTQNKRNIVMLGGSVAFGYGATNNKQTISSFLGEKLRSDGYEIFNLAQGGYTSFMDLFSLASIGLYLEPDIIIVMEGYADTYHLAYKSIGGELAWGPFSQSEQKTDPEFSFGLHFQNLNNILRLGTNSNHESIIALQPLSGFENNSTVEIKKIKKMWGFYPQIRETMKLAAKNNNAEFVDLSVIFKEEKKASINFFDKVHLTVTGQRKVAEVLYEKIKYLRAKKPDTVNSSQLRKTWIKNILEKNYKGTYKTAEDY